MGDLFVVTVVSSEAPSKTVIDRWRKEEQEALSAKNKQKLQSQKGVHK